MHNFTHNNHFKFGYDGEWFRPRQSTEESYQVTYGACEREPGTFKEECLTTARMIRDSTDEPLVVLFSGGSESEMVVRSFAEQKIPISAAICQFNNNLNLHDIAYAVVCCEQLGVPYKMFPLDLDDFYKSGQYLEYAEPTKLTTPELCSTMWCCDQLDGVPIIGTGECYIVKRVPEGYVTGVSPYEATPWDLFEREHIAAWYRQFMVPGKERLAVPGFFRYTPEIILSYLRDDTIQQLVNNQLQGKRSTTSSKLKIYSKYFSLAPRHKFTGYEKLAAKLIEIRRDVLRPKFPQSRNIFLTEYNDLVSILEGKLEGPKGFTMKVED